MFETALFVKDQLFVFSSLLNRKKKKHFLFVQNFDPNSVELVDNLKLIAELNYADLNKFDYTSFWFNLSPDSSKILIYYSLRSNKSGCLRSGFMVFGNDFQLIRGKEDATARFSEGIFEFSRVKVDNEGGVYVTGKQ